MHRRLILVVAIALSAMSVGCSGSTPTKSEIQQVKARHEKSLLSLDGVTGVGIGEIERKPCIVVYLADDSARARVPDELEGFPVKKEVTGQIVPFPEGSMKGYELYSWKSGDTWYFSLLPGTNRMKSKEEVRSAGVAVEGVEAIEAQLGRLENGQRVAWLVAQAGATAPPSEVLERVSGFCKDAGIVLEIPAPPVPGQPATSPESEPCPCCPSH